MYIFNLNKSMIFWNNKCKHFINILKHVWFKISYQTIFNSEDNLGTVCKRESDVDFPYRWNLSSIHRSHSTFLLIKNNGKLGSGCDSVGTWSLPTPEIHGSNPFIGKLLLDIYLFPVNCIEKTKIKQKEVRIGHF